jgi:hypothetical protein
MAKKAVEKINRSAAIKAYRESHPAAKPKEVAAAISKQLGIEIKPTYVSIVSQNAKKKTGKKTGRHGKAFRGVRVGNGFAATLSAASEFIKAAGGIDAAIEALQSIALMPMQVRNG